MFQPAVQLGVGGAASVFLGHNAPTGAPVTISPEGTGVAMAAGVNCAMARWKDMAPGTNVVYDRLPEAYGALLREEAAGPA